MGRSRIEGIDPIVVSAQIIGALQTIVSRSIEPIEGGVVSIGSISGGEAYNILPERVMMKGTARWYRAGGRGPDRVGDAPAGEGDRGEFWGHGGAAVLPPCAGDGERCGGDGAGGGCGAVGRRVGMA